MAQGRSLEPKQRRGWREDRVINERRWAHVLIMYVLTGDKGGPAPAKGSVRTMVQNQAQRPDWLLIG